MQPVLPDPKDPESMQFYDSYKEVCAVYITVPLAVGGQISAMINNTIVLCASLLPFKAAQQVISTNQDIVALTELWSASY